MSKSSLSEKAYKEIKKLIVHNTLKPGQFITELEMQERLQIGRTPVRDAFRELERDQLVVIHSRRGVEVANISPKKIREIFEVRWILEPEILYRNMKMLDRDWLLDLKEKFSTVVDCESADLEQEIIELAGADDRFHKTITELCDNSYINKLLSSTFDYLAMIRVITSHDVDRFNASNKEHVEIIDCIVAGDAEEATAKLRAHIETSLEATLLNLLESAY